MKANLSAWPEELKEAIGLRSADLDERTDVLTFRFHNRTEVWLPAPPGYPTDGSVEVIRINDRLYIPPHRGDRAES